ncbi:MAG: hypothetical protein AAF593_03315 [Planctomycetota bacterium]
MRSVYAAFLAIFVTSIAAGEAAADPNISGSVSFIENKQYKPIEGVEVIVMREAPVSSGKSDAGGQFTIDYAAGRPVHVVFFGPTNSVPELQSLSGQETVTHSVHVTLYTLDQANALNINVFQYVAAIRDKLLASGVAGDDQVIQRLQEYMNQVG